MFVKAARAYMAFNSQAYAMYVEKYSSALKVNREAFGGSVVNC